MPPGPPRHGHAPPATPDWLPWGPPAFRRARDEGRPILLLVETAWSGACRAFRADTLADPDLAAALSALVVPVRADADERPDLADRYTFGGWPTVSLLTPEGAVLAAAAAPAAGPFGQWLAEVTSRFASDAGALRLAGSAHLLRVPEPPPGCDVDAAMPAEAIALVTARLCGPGPGPAGLDADSWLLALGTTDQAVRGELAGRLRHLLDDTLRDGGTGAIARVAPEAEREADEAPLLAVQADAVRVLAAAAHACAMPHLAGLARELLAVVDRDFGTGDGLWRFAALAGDRRVLVDACARAAQAHLHAALPAGDDGLAARGVEALEVLAARAYRPGAGIAHVLGPGPRVGGLLGDQVAMAEALADAAGIAGRHAYLDLAHELMRSAVARLWDDRAGAFRDRVTSPAGAGDAGLLAHPAWPIDLNCAAARVLARLARGAGDTSLDVLARRILATFGDAWRESPVSAAAYALAVAEVLGDRA